MFGRICQVHPQRLHGPLFLFTWRCCEGTKGGLLTEDVWHWLAGVVELAAVELQADDGEHEDGEEQQQADLQQRHHGLDDGLQHDLQAWSEAET